MAADTGNGFAVTLATTTTTGWLFKEVDLGEESVPDINDSHLATTNYETFFPGDLKEPGEVTFSLLVDATKASPAIGTVELLTGTFPISTSGNLTNATFTGTGYIKRVKRPRLVNNEVQMYDVTFKLDGKSTEPTFTVES